MTKYHCPNKLHPLWHQGDVAWVGYDILSRGEIHLGEALEEPAIKIQQIINSK
jgi:hypothetical protein